MLELTTSHLFASQIVDGIGGRAWILGHPNTSSSTLVDVVDDKISEESVANHNIYARKTS